MIMEKKKKIAGWRGIYCDGQMISGERGTEFLASPRRQMDRNRFESRIWEFWKY